MANSESQTTPNRFGAHLRFWPSLGEVTWSWQEMSNPETTPFRKLKKMPRREDVERGQEMRDAALYALICRAGGHVQISVDELPDRPFSFARRWTDEGGIEILARVDGAPS